MLRLRPMNTLFQFLFGEMNFVGLTDLVPGVILFVYGCISVQFQWTLHNTAAMLCAVVGGTLLRGAFYLGFGSLTFWTKSPFHVSRFFQELFNRTNMYTLPYGMAFVTLALGIALFAVACAVFRAGFKQYESAGS